MTCAKSCWYVYRTATRLLTLLQYLYFSSTRGKKKQVECQSNAFMGLFGIKKLPLPAEGGGQAKTQVTSQSNTPLCLHYAYIGSSIITSIGNVWDGRKKKLPEIKAKLQDNKSIQEPTALIWSYIITFGECQQVTFCWPRFRVDTTSTSHWVVLHGNEMLEFNI